MLAVPEPGLAKKPRARSFLLEVGLQLLLERRQAGVLMLVFIKPLGYRLDPGDDPAPVFVGPVHQEPVHLGGDAQPGRAVLAKGPEPLADLGLGRQSSRSRRRAASFP